MLTRYRSIVAILFRASDIFVIVFAWVAAYWARFYALPPNNSPTLPPFETYASLAPLVALVWATVLSFMGIYESGRMRTRAAEVLLLWRAHGVALLLFVVASYFYDQTKYSRLVIIYLGLLGGILLASLRIVVRSTLRHLRKHGYDLRSVLIVGDGRSVDKLVERMATYPELGMRLLGVVTRTGRPRTSTGKPVLGTFEVLHDVVEREHPDEVIIALSRDEQHEMAGVLTQLRNVSLYIRVIPDLYEYVTLGCRVDTFEGLPILRLDDSPMDHWGAAVKRLVDIILSGVGLIILSPLLAALAILVKVTSRGPILYTQERAGLDGRPFFMFKFRSMRLDAEAVSGPVWARAGDDRRTPIGALLRRTSLDELPQLWNVFVGDMALVGPRPERPVFVDRFRNEIPYYMLRHKVKAGITGWAQVNGWRGDTSLPDRIACDLYYIQHWSLNLDLKILALTFWRGFVHKNAY